MFKIYCNFALDKETNGANPMININPLIPI